ncbi:MAG: hypothetical protein ACRDA3_13130 [Peptostreptococcaceae bacterium]
MNCGSCVYREIGCKYQALKKSIENDIWQRDISHILMLSCTKYENRTYLISKEEMLKLSEITQTEIDACGEVEFE